MTIKERLYLTADRKKVVRAGDGRARFLFAAPNQEITKKEAETYGIVDGKLPEKNKLDKPEIKQAGQPENKAVEKVKNKSKKEKK